MSDAAGGSTIGTLGGAGLGFALGGPAGAGIGAYGGKLLGGAIGGLFGGSSGPSPQQIYEDQLKQREAAVFARESALADHLQSVANGQGPSVAGQQLGQGLDQISRNALTQAAGTTGNGGVLARFGAMQAAATAGAQANQSQSLVRAQEIANANQQLGGVLGNQATQSTGMLGTVTGAQNAANANNINSTKNSSDAATNLLGSGLNGLAQGGAASTSSGPQAQAPTLGHSLGLPLGVDDENPAV